MTPPSPARGSAPHADPLERMVVVPPLGAVLEALEAGNPLGAWAALTQYFRDGGKREAEGRLRVLCQILRERSDLRERLGAGLLELVEGQELFQALTESGVPSARGFAGELLGRISSRILPELEDPGDIRTLIHGLFPHGDDAEWLQAVPRDAWVELLETLGIRHDSGGAPPPALENALRAVAHHVASLGLRPEITERLPNLARADSPFLRLSPALEHLLEAQRAGDEDLLSVRHAAAVEVAHRCRDEIQRLRREKGVYGTGLRLTGISFRILGLLERFETLMILVVSSGASFQGAAVDLTRALVKAEARRLELFSFIRGEVDLLAYQVAEHAARKGSKYITSGRADYFRFFRASLGGGAIVAVFASIKLLLYKLDLPLGVEALLYGANYSLCFSLIYLTGSALATKQPSMTASTVAQALDGAEGTDMAGLADLVVRVWRSQFVSFLGNLAMAIPAAILLAEVLSGLGWTVADADKSMGLLEETHPWRSGTAVYAAVAGVFLFTAGLLAGWVENRNLASRLPQRVSAHPLSNALLGHDKSHRLGAFFEKNAGVLTGNIFLGFALGSTGTLGEILGLPLDIRHIAFSSANLGTALAGLDYGVAADLLYPVILGVLLIGFVNFIVSFGLSLVMAMESREVRGREVRTLVRHLWVTLLTRPRDWIIPPADTPTAPSGN